MYLRCLTLPSAAVNRTSRSPTPRRLSASNSSDSESAVKPRRKMPKRKYVAPPVTLTESMDIPEESSTKFLKSQGTAPDPFSDILDISVSSNLDFEELSDSLFEHFE